MPEAPLRMHARLRQFHCSRSHEVPGPGKSECHLLADMHSCTSGCTGDLQPLNYEYKAAMSMSSKGVYKDMQIWHVTCYALQVPERKNER
jgi:hypothetical protein